MARPDLMVLTVPALSALANAGLVKRAQRELAAASPVLDELADGTVTATFADGVITRLPPGTSLRDAPCSCGAAGVCRHRLATVLAYQATGAVAPVASRAIASISDDELRELLGKRTFEAATALFKRGLVAEVRRTPPGVSLPTCSVQFLAAAELAHCRCDCEVGLHCAHVALAVWAFRAADAQDAAAPRLTVALASRATTPLEALAQAEALVGELLTDGVVHTSPALGQRLAVTHEALERAGAAWPAAVLADLETELDRYRARSARYSSLEIARLFAELPARAQAARTPGVLPASYVLGEGESPETRLDRLRLVGLGALIHAEGANRVVEVFLADPDTGMVVVMERELEFSDTSPAPPGHELAERMFSPQLRLGSLAAGQLVTRAARRRPSRVLTLGRGSGGATSLTPMTGDLAMLGEPLRLASLGAVEVAWKGRPPRCLRPRVRAEDVHVLDLVEVTDLHHDPATQRVSACGHLPDGGTVLLGKSYHAAAPEAHHTAARALQGAAGAVRGVTGVLRSGAHGFEVELIAVAADRLIVLDLVTLPTGPPVPRGRLMTPADPVAAAIAQAAELLAEASHQGLRHLGEAFSARLIELGRGCRDLGLTAGAQHLRELALALDQARVGDGSTWPAAISAWTRAALRFQLMAEQ